MKNNKMMDKSSALVRW